LSLKKRQRFLASADLSLSRTKFFRPQKLRFQTTKRFVVFIFAFDSFRFARLAEENDQIPMTND